MSAAKDLMTRVINDQPGDSSFDEILRELAFVRMIERGLQDSEAGRVFSDEQVNERIRSWRKSAGPKNP
jgi:predicted transcriptional regulator